MIIVQEHEEIAAVLHNAPVGVHFVNAQGVIIYANPHELEVLGYQHDDYVGHNTAEFQVDMAILGDMLVRLQHHEILTNYPAKVRAKIGIKYFLFNSSVYFKDGKFIHTRCFTANISKCVFDSFVKESEYYK